MGERSCEGCGGHDPDERAQGGQGDGLEDHRDNTGPLVQRFPEPSRLIKASIAQLELASEAAMDSAHLAKLAGLPRPWEPGSCTGEVRRDLWLWLEEVAHWINAEHLWAVDRPGIPECWPRHPHLVHDLATLATTRYVTTHAFSPIPLETWHRVVLPAFLDRVAERLGGDCRTGHRGGPPRADRDREYRRGPTAARRQAQFHADVAADAGAEHVDVR